MPRHLPPEVLTAAEVAALLDACRGDRWLDLRNRALIALLYRAGLRISEALALLPKEVDRESALTAARSTLSTADQQFASTRAALLQKVMDGVQAAIGADGAALCERPR